MFKGYKYRLYPNSQQQEQIVKTIGCCRFVYNHMLAESKAAHEYGERLTTRNQFNNKLASLKKELPWLREADSTALQAANDHLAEAFGSFFHMKSGYPTFHKKKAFGSYTSKYTAANIKVFANGVQLPKLGVVKAKIHRVAPESWRIKSATVSQEGDGKFYVSVLYEYETDITPLSATEDTTLGLDFKASKLYAASNGSFGNMPKYYKQAAAKLAKKQRKLKHKQVGSSNYQKEQRKIAKHQKHTHNQRKDFLHKQSAAIAKQYDFVCVEDLSIQQMTKERKYKRYRKSVLDNGWCAFVQMLDYKLQDKGGQLIKVDKLFPSSQLCSICGILNPKVKDDSIRKWTCPHCGATHDRDINAAVNIKMEGLRMLTAS